MKRRIVIFGGTVALYAVVMVVAWVVGTRQATQKTEGMLDYAVNDVRVSMGGVIDTLLDHLASVAVRNFSEPIARSMAEVAAVAEVFDIDELNVVDRTGRIIATNDPDCLGVDMTVKDETRPFLELTNGVTRVVSQPFRRHAYSNSYRKYLGVPFPGGNGYVQVGLDEARMNRMIAAHSRFSSIRTWGTRYATSAQTRRRARSSRTTSRTACRGRSPSSGLMCRLSLRAACRSLARAGRWAQRPSCRGSADGSCSAAASSSAGTVSS